MKRPLLALFACLLFASISFAQQTDANAPASKADIERYLDAMHTRDMMKSMMDLMKKQFHQMVHEQVQKDPNLPPDFEEREDKKNDSMFNESFTNEIIDVMVPIYQKHFTKDEVDALIAFYATPTGQKYLKELPLITAESMQAASGIAQKMMAKATQRLQDEIAQMQKSDDGKSTKQSPATPN
jgi:uncharacterized protein